jgi:arginyl-tRNA synthetase
MHDDGGVDSGDLRWLVDDTVDGGTQAAGGVQATKPLMLTLAGFSAMVATAYDEIAPHRVAAYAYQLSNTLNTFYHETKILTESVQEKKKAYLALLTLTKEVLETCIDLLGFSAPERM